MTQQGGSKRNPHECPLILCKRWSYCSWREFRPDNSGCTYYDTVKHDIIKEEEKKL